MNYLHNGTKFTSMIVTHALVDIDYWRQYFQYLEMLLIMAH